MSAWRRVALETLPEYRLLIDEAWNPMSLWIELQMKFIDLYRQEVLDDNLIGRVFEYARWCRQSGRQGVYLSDTGTAVVCAFYEHLPQNAAIRLDLHRWLTSEEFGGLRGAFAYHLSAEQYAEFEAVFAKKRLLWRAPVPKHSRKPR